MNEFIREETDSDSLQNQLKSDHDDIRKEYEAQKPVQPVRYNPKSTSFVVPATAGRLQRTITLEKTDCEYKKLIYSAIYSAYYQYFFTDDYPPSTKQQFLTIAPTIVTYLNAYVFTEGREIGFFRSYEAYRINEDKVLPQSTGLASLVSWIVLVSSINAYSKNLLYWQIKFFKSVSKIRSLGNTDYDSRQVTLTDWFGFSTWLRRGDVGVGHELYCKLASPKALVNSFVATITVALNEIQFAKDALIKFFKENEVSPSEFSQKKKKDDFKDRYDYRQYIAIHKKDQLNKLRDIFHASENKDRYVKLAMALVIREFVQADSYEYMLQKFFNNETLNRIKKSNGRAICMISTHDNETLIGSRLLAELAEYASLSDRLNVDKPKSIAEQMIFSWLMAYQTVQPTDILKLKLIDFTFVKRVNGQVTHISLEYFKGRANTIHQVKTLETKTLLGSVVLKYIQDITSESKEDRNKSLVTNFNTFQVTVKKLFEFCDSDIVDSINVNLEKEKVSPVFLKSMLAIIRNGKRYSPKGKISSGEYFLSGDLKCRKNLFTLTAIKNSSVHSRSDTFTPTQLINYHSHSNTVEKMFYLTISNEEWLNNAGLITRAVMQDLSANLYRASLNERREFNSEFTHAAEIITNKKNDFLSKVKMYTGKEQGEVNNLGLAKRPVVPDTDFADTIYLLDSPETVFKLINYLDQVKKNHQLLAIASSEFLLFTVLPTVEWIEELFDRKSFSKEAISHGRSLFNQHGSNLPPLFQNQIN